MSREPDPLPRNVAIWIVAAIIAWAVGGGIGFVLLRVVGL
jgi:hypothetical protein